MPEIIEASDRDDTDSSHSRSNQTSSAYSEPSEEEAKITPDSLAPIQQEEFKTTPRTK